MFYSGSIGFVSKDHTEAIREKNQIERGANGLKERKAKNRAKGRNSAIKRYLRRKQNVVEEKKEYIMKQLNVGRQQQKSTDGVIASKDHVRQNPLDRFKRKTQ
ncbi:hypothetical protein MP228_006031 [Amoeboaphelidium protococcarum]|nr:hypothetical protein MP228_006031 [Amoeboaphelidium protococcarum]